MIIIKAYKASMNEKPTELLHYRHDKYLQ